MAGQKRNYGVDLLRIVLMVLIIIGHLYAHTMIRSQLPFLSDKWVFTWITQAVSVCAVDCFVIITGYFMFKATYSLWGVVKLWSKVIFYSIVVTGVLVAVGKIAISWSVFLNAFFPVFRREYWFFTMYMLLYLLIPFLNTGLSNMTKKMHDFLVIIILFFFYIEPLMSVVFYEYDGTEGFSIIAFVTLYVIGAWLARCQDIPKKTCLYMLIGSSFLMFLSKIILEMIIAQLGLSFGAGLLYHNNSLFVLVNAVALFEFFKQIELKSGVQKVVGWISPSVFTVYLLHEKPAVRKIIWNEQLVIFLKECNFGFYCLVIFGIAIGIFIVGIVVEKILTWIVFQQIEKTSAADKIKKCCNLYNSIINQCD